MAPGGDGKKKADQDSSHWPQLIARRPIAGPRRPFTRKDSGEKSRPKRDNVRLLPPLESQMDPMALGFFFSFPSRTMWTSGTNPFNDCFSSPFPPP